MPNKKIYRPTEKNIEDYSLLKNMLHAQRKEFDLLSSKKPNEQLNPMKIKMVNRVLEPLKEILRKEDSYKFLDTLQEDEMPTNSDVVLIISQFEMGISEFRDKYYREDEYKKDQFRHKVSRWMTEEFPPDHYASEAEDDEI